MRPLDEWLLTDGLGGFASGTVSGVRTRRYHALLLAAQTPPTRRVVLVNGFDAWVETPGGRWALSTHHYLPDVRHPDGAHRIVDFAYAPWPRWRFRLPDGTEVEQELVAARGTPSVMLAWRLVTPAMSARLVVRPFLSGRDTHALHRENSAFRFDAAVAGDRVAWHPYPSLPQVIARSNGRYAHDPIWYRNFLYAEERARGLDDVEDLAAPGSFVWELADGEALLLLAAGIAGADADSTSRGDPLAPGSVSTLADRIRAAAVRRAAAAPSPLHRAADDYIVRRGAGRTLIAGYPWFTDWGRDTFIALRGLCIATGRLDVARDILVDWAGAVSEGMLPNYFPEAGAAPEFNSVDASLWYVVAVHDFLRAAGGAADAVARRDHERLREGVAQIVEGYRRGTRFRIGADGDGLLAAGEPGVQLTWMDAKVGDSVVTPRVGKPVEVQALWINALRIGATLIGESRWDRLAACATASFDARFWSERHGWLHDVVDLNHVPGTADPTCRPNQALAVGGLPYAILSGARARAVVDAIERQLWTPLGLRSLAPGEPEYVAHYEGGVRERDGSYHQGTVWPWLIGPFVDAWVGVRGASAEVRQEARARFLAPLLRHLEEAGLGHVSEIADAELPHTPRGCPFQAWSVGEALRLTHGTLAEPDPVDERAGFPAGAAVRLAFESPAVSGR